MKSLVSDERIQGNPSEIQPPEIEGFRSETATAKKIQTSAISHDKIQFNAAERTLGPSRPAPLARLGRRGGSERRRDVDDGRGLAFETRQRQRPHVLSRPEPPSEIDRVGRPARVGDDKHLIAEIAGVPRRCFERMGRERAA